MDGKMEVSMEKMMVNLLARKMEKMKGEPIVKMTGLMKVTSWGLMTGKPLV